jgi:hypothetical protein
VKTVSKDRTPPSTLAVGGLLGAILRLESLDVPERRRAMRLLRETLQTTVSVPSKKGDRGPDMWDKLTDAVVRRVLKTLEEVNWDPADVPGGE